MGVKYAVEAPPESDRFAPAPHPRDTFGFFGHRKAEAELLDAYRVGRLPQAWIFGGPQGIGKATLAWRMARFLAAHPDPAAPAVQNAQTLDVDPDHPAARKISALSFGDLALLRREWQEKNKKHATRIGVDEVRRAIHIFEQAAGEGGWRMALIDSADDFNASSANALLKLIEEPPPRCLFLIVAHQPGRILPTIASRCRRLMMQGLAPHDLAAAARAALEAAEEKVVEADLLRACARADGSVREALRLLSRADADFDALVEGSLAPLPRVDWRLIHRLADRVTGRERETEYDAFLQAMFGWLAAALRRHEGQGPRVLAPYATAWESLEREARDLEIFNLDKRAFVLIVFSHLAEAENAARAALKPS
ncbi:DNA polymerase III subunit delta' [uncultured Rhodoblastus sp.]|uniref:DNA polymerase III subunit delta' n=1 Tax=uncultured Rhodoblastus sp. TaxID=543037 RepID=UPI0025E65410|nr:DNA polymerase III subunit delta' [uncultured Rhodoblastus sp.]